jgi:DUF4097 and DUF4098 domain-containing protein YvlB
MVMTIVRSRAAAAAPLLPVLFLAMVGAAGCDIAMAEFKEQETAQWRKTYELQPGGRVEINNVNGKIAVQPAAGNTLEVVADKIGKGASTDAARAALTRIEIREEASPSSVRIDTRIERTTGMFNSGGLEVRYAVRVPAGADVKFTTVNGGIELDSHDGRIVLETTNGGIHARNVKGAIEASTTNGGVDVELAEVAQAGARLKCTNGGIKLRLPADAKATISARVTNGGIDAGGLSLDTTEASRRRVEGRLNGGGARIELAGTNGGIRIGPR